MFTEIKYTNFQKHKSRKIKLDPHITTIIGPNDKGKSALLRGLRWVCLNQPSGEDFRTWGTKNTEVRLKVDGSKVSRSRGGDNLYVLDGKVYKAFGANVPAAIADLLNVTEDNFQDQFDSSFWLSEPPGQVAKKLNQIINLGIIDEALSFITSENRRNKTEVELCQSRLSEAVEKKKQLRWIKKFSKRVEALQKEDSEIQKLEGKIEKLRALTVKVQQYEDLVLNVGPAVLQGQILVKKAEELSELEDQIGRLKDLLADVKDADFEIESLENTLHKKRHILGKVKSCPACGQKMS